MFSYHKCSLFFTLCFFTLLFTYVTNNPFTHIGTKYPLVAQSYRLAKALFDEGKAGYISLKERSLISVDNFIDLAYIMNEEMAKELRSTILKFHKVKYFHDFTNYAISLEDIVDIVEHCLIEPVEKLELIRSQFTAVIRNFEDSRNFSVVSKCADELPDEVSAAHCLLHQAVLFNETMADNLVKIVEIKTRQHALDVNSSMYSVEICLKDFVPRFFDQIMVDAYTAKCGFMKVFNASLLDLLEDKWRYNRTVFHKKWGPLVNLLKEKDKHQSKEPLFLTLFAANLTSRDIYHK